MKTDFPKIETWRSDYDWKRQAPFASRPLVTTWSRTVFEARQSRARELGCDVTDILGRRVKP